jgi:hypothetical protein
MALRPGLKTRSKEPNAAEESLFVVDQRKAPDERYRLQVDRQTKRSFSALDAAVEAGLAIKKAHPIVRVSVYDAVDGVNQTIGADGLVATDSTPA